jgi:signal transduction histidine kinase
MELDCNCPERYNQELEQGMNLQNLHKLAALIRCERDALLSQWRKQVRQLPSAKHLDALTLDDHISILLEELAASFQSVTDETIQKALLEGSPPIHGLERYKNGFDIVEVVEEYNILRGCIHDLAESNGFNLQGNTFRILNRVFDQAIGLAVQTFATQQALEVRRRREEHLAFVAHDLRTPLNAISLATRVLDMTLAKQGKSKETAQMLKTLYRNVQHLEALVQKILKESADIQTETGIKLKRRKFDLWPLVEALIHDLHPVAGTASVQIINQIPEELTAYADANMLRRVFQNLVANAIRYTPRGEIIIGAREAKEGAIECWVSDNGAGIPKDRLEIIFDKLETDPDKDCGTGLGLSIVKTFIEAHGGTVAAKSKEGIGSTFWFTLPGRKISGT